MHADDRCRGAMSTKIAIDRLARVKRATGRAVAIAGREGKLAAACGVTQPASPRLSLRAGFRLALLLPFHGTTTSLVPASELRPDLWRWKMCPSKPEARWMAAGDGCFIARRD